MYKFFPAILIRFRISVYRKMVKALNQGETDNKAERKPYATKG